MEKKALLIFNPKSGDSKLQLEELKERVLLHLSNYELESFVTSGEGDLSKIKEEINLLNPELLLIAGGDGTVKLVAESNQTQTPMAVLPLGSANGLAKCLGIDTLEDGLDALRGLETIAMDGLKINGEPCLHMSDFGLNANIIEKFEEEGERGMIGYVKGSISQLFSTPRYRFQLSSKGESWDFDAHMLVIANGDRYGTGAVINPTGKLDDGKFEVIAIDFIRWDDFFSITKGMLEGEVPDSENIRTWTVDSCEIKNLQSANFQIDGEVKGNPNEIEVILQVGQYKMVVRKSS
ncbi:MAG: diacylglycerol/lipid kinase family protein [Bacteroidota bacterium]